MEIAPVKCVMGERLPQAAQTHIALLRAINLGSKNKLPMKDLIEIFAAAGCCDVQTYILSGNVVFSAPGSLAARLPAEINAQVAKRFGFSTPVVLRTALQLRQVFENNPFLKMGAPEETLHVMFLAEQPSRSAIASLDPERSAGDTFVVCGREIYLRLPNGVARSKLTNAYFDGKLATASTSRNWRTVAKLQELATAFAS